MRDSTKFKPGTSGNPAGKPKGTRNIATRKALAILQGGGEEVLRVVVDAAKNGDLVACRIVIDKLVPNARERAIELPGFPDTSSPEGINAAQQQILEAVAEGHLTPGEASTLSGVAENRRRAMETLELAERISQLESRLRK